MPLKLLPTSKYRWNTEAQRYVDARGSFVPASAIREEIDAALKTAALRARALAEQLRTRSLSPLEWEFRMRELSKEVHLYSAAAARGGWSQMTQDDFGRVGRVVRGEYAWILGFRGEIEDGLPLDGRFLARVELYAEAGRESYHRVERQVQLEQGNTIERSILGVADHCDGCVAEAARGWVPIGLLVPIGQRTCGRRCKCEIEYSSVRKIADRHLPPTPPQEDGGSPYRGKYASAVMDMHTCAHCAQFDGVVVRVDDPRRLPDHGCTSARGCQCQWIFIRKEEEA